MCSITAKGVLLSSVVALLLVASAPADEEGTWVDLLAAGGFSKNWTTTGNWSIDDKGVVTLIPRPGEQGWRRFDAYLWLKQQYGDFEIEFEYQHQKHGNSGFYFHVGDKTSPVVKGIEVQIYDSHGRSPDKPLNDHTAGGIIPDIPPTKNAARVAGEWNRFHITCQEGVVSVELNGQEVNEFLLEHPKIADRPASGYIGFQDHGLPFYLRNIRIRRP